MSEQIQYTLPDGRVVQAETQNLFDFFLNDMENISEQLTDLSDSIKTHMIGDAKKLQELTEKRQRIPIVRMSGAGLAKQGVKHWSPLDVIAEGPAPASCPSTTRIRQAMDSLDELEWYLDGKVPRDPAEERRLLKQAIRRLESHLSELADKCG